MMANFEKSHHFGETVAFSFPPESKKSNLSWSSPTSYLAEGSKSETVSPKPLAFVFDLFHPGAEPSHFGETVAFSLPSESERSNHTWRPE